MVFKKIICLLSIFVIQLLNNRVIGVQENITLLSPAAIITEVSSGRILYSKNMKEKRKIASTTKIMTSILAMENCKMDEAVIISKKAAGTGGSGAGIREGESITIKNLLYGLMLESGNDCAVAIAEYISGSTEEFAKLMNIKAKEIGAFDTNYTNPHGLDTEENYCTAYDLALITKKAMEYPELIKIMSTQEIEVPFGNRNVYLANTNRLIHTYEYCIAGKTGYTGIAEKCITTIGRMNDMEIITVVLGSPTSDIRFDECKKLMKYAFDTYKLTDISEYLNWYINIPVYKGNIEKYERAILENMVLPIKDGEVENIFVKQTLLPVIHTPLSKGAILGDISMYIGNEKIYEKEITLDIDLPKNNVWYYMKKGIRDMFNIDLKFI